MDAVKCAPKTPAKRAADERDAIEAVGSSDEDDMKAKPEASVAAARPMLMAFLPVEGWVMGSIGSSKRERSSQGDFNCQGTKLHCGVTVTILL